MTDSSHVPVAALVDVTANPLLRARALRRVYRDGGRDVAAIDAIDMDIETGSWVAIVGRSGSGKSTLLNLIGGLDRAYQGSLQLGNAELAGLDDRSLSRLRNRTIGFVFQGFNLLANLSVGANVMMPAHFGSGMAPRAAQHRAHELLDRVGLGGFFDERPRTLSGGEQQRVAIARALMLEPPLLICDEPTGNLDPETSALVLGLFGELHRSQATTIVMVTHDPEAARHAERVLRLERGRFLPSADSATATDDDTGSAGAQTEAP